MDLKDLTTPESLKYITTIITTVTGAIVSVLYGLKRQKKKYVNRDNDNTNKVLEQFKQTNEKLDILSTKVKQLETNIETISKKSNVISSEVSDIKEQIKHINISMLDLKVHAERTVYENKVRREIKKVTSEFIRDNNLNTVKDEQFVSLIYHGRDASIIFANDCINSGLKGLDIKDLDIGISSIFDSLRIVAERYMDNRFINELKSNSRAYAHIEAFKAELKKISDNYWNGKTNEIFLSTITTFVTNMYNNGLKIYIKLKEDDNITMR
jgi:hypothetical protein